MLAANCAESMMTIEFSVVHRLHSCVMASLVPGAERAACILDQPLRVAVAVGREEKGSLIEFHRDVFDLLRGCSIRLISLISWTSLFSQSTTSFAVEVEGAEVLVDVVDILSCSRSKEGFPWKAFRTSGLLKSSFVLVRTV